MVKTLQINGARGEVTPLMHARTDTAFYQEAFAEARNVVITRFGPTTRVPGTVFIGEPRNFKQSPLPVRTMPFEFSATQVYSIEFGVNYVRFWLPDGRLVTYGGGTIPYEVATPFSAADLPYLHTVQSGDELYIFSFGRHRVKKLTRFAEDNWVLSDYAPVNGPYMDINSTPTVLTLSGTNRIVPFMTSSTMPEGLATGTGSLIPAGAAWYAFDGRAQSEFRITNANIGYVQYQAVSARVCNSYWMQASTKESTSTPNTWELKGSNNGTDWVTLDARSGEKGWGRGEKRYFNFDNKQAFLYHRLEWEGTEYDDGDSDTEDSRIAELALAWDGDAMPPVLMSASATAGINDGNGFLGSDVGRYLRIRGSDGRWRYVRIMSVLNALQVMVKIYGDALPDLSPINAWQIGKWSDYSGWPYTGTFFEDRFVTAGTNSDPIGMWMSVQGDYDGYRVNDPMEDDDAISLRLTGGKIDAIRWLIENGVLLAGTASALRSVGGRDRSAPLTNDNVRQRSETNVKASEVRPENVENFVIFADDKKTRLYESAYNYEADGYVAREVTVVNEHLFKYGVEQIAYLSHPHKYVIARRNDGKLVFFAYDRDQKIAGGTLVDFGVFVEDISVLNGNQLWMVVRREMSPGVFFRTIEVMAPFFDPETMSTPIMTASSMRFTGSGMTSVGGVMHLVGKTVGVWADGRDLGNATVEYSGVVQLPFGTAANNVVIGVRIPFRIKTLRTPILQDGSGFGQKLRIISAHVDVLNTAGIRCGGLTNIEELQDPEYIEEDPDQVTELLTGMYGISFDDSFANGGVFVIEGSSMHPATIRAIMLEVEGET